MQLQLSLSKTLKINTYSCDFEHDILMVQTPERKLDDILQIYQLIYSNKHILKYCLMLIGEDQLKNIPGKAKPDLITITFVVGNN